MSGIRYQVFVSSTYNDLIEHRQKVIHALMSVSAIPVGMELFPAADEDAWSVITRTIDLSDYYIVIIGGKYGSVDSKGISYTEREYDYAVSKGIPVMAFLHKCPEELKGKNLEDDAKKRKKLAAFRKKAERKHCKYWLDESDLVPQVLSGFMRVTVDKPGIGWIRGSEARTREDAEYLANLERKVRDLESRLAMIDKDDAEVETVHANLQKKMLKIEGVFHESDQTKNEEVRQHRITVEKSAFDAFALLGDMLIDGPTERQLHDRLTGKILAERNLSASSGRLEISNETIAIIKLCFAKRNLIIVRTNNDGLPFDPLINRTWHITALGKRLLDRIDEDSVGQRTPRD